MKRGFPTREFAIMTRRWIAAVVLLAVVAVGGWFGYSWLRPASRPPAIVETPIADAGQASDNGIETVDGADSLAPVNGGTPMAQRTAVIGLLNKRNSEHRDFKMRVGQAIRTGDVVIRLRACERTTPWEQHQLTGAFVQLDVRGVDQHWRRVFSGWLYKERPALNVVQHPIYDVWTKSCTMSLPDRGPDTDVLGDAPERSSAKKSPDAQTSPRAGSDAPAMPDKAPSSNAM